MKKGLILAGEPMGLLIAQSEGDLSGVSGYDLAVAGAEFNVAIGAARLGHRVTYLTKLGKDPFGERIIHVLNENGIRNEFVSWSDEKRTGFMLKGRVHAGDPPIFYFRAGSAASTLSPQDVENVDFSAYSHIHLTGILPALTEATRAATLLMFERARAAGLTISFDPNLRPQLWPCGSCRYRPAGHGRGKNPHGERRSCRHLRFLSRARSNDCHHEMRLGRSLCRRWRGALQGHRIPCARGRRHRRRGRRLCGGYPHWADGGAAHARCRTACGRHWCHPGDEPRR